MKSVLSAVPVGRPGPGVTVLIYHRVGGGSGDERDVSAAQFTRHLDILADRDVVSIDRALDALGEGDRAPRVVLTFDDGFADVHRNAYPLLVERRLPFTLYVATRYVGRSMHWDGSTATSAGPGLDWPQIEEMVASGLCTVGNHTHGHVRPGRLDVDEIDRCSDLLEERLGVRPRHFAYPWGIPVPRMEPVLRERFRSVATGEIGRNLPGDDLLRLRRVPVRQSDPPSFFAAKLDGELRPERTYARMVAIAKRLFGREPVGTTAEPTPDGRPAGR